MLPGLLTAVGFRCGGLNAKDLSELSFVCSRRRRQSHQVIATAQSRKAAPMHSVTSVAVETEITHTRACAFYKLFVAISWRGNCMRAIVNGAVSRDTGYDEKTDIKYLPEGHWEDLRNPNTNDVFCEKVCISHF